MLQRLAVRTIALGLLVLAVLAAGAAPAAAHPLGNFTVNTHVGVRVEPAAVALDVVLDVAEVPTLRAFPGIDAESGGDAVPEQDQRAYRERTCPALRDAFALQLDGAPVGLVLVDSALRFPPGSAGLATTRLECTLRSAAPTDTVGRQLVLTDSLAVQPVGWREITAVGDGVGLVGSTVPERSASDVLRDYPQDRLDSPLDVRGATLGVVRGSGVVTGGGLAAGTPGPDVALRGLDPFTTAFTGLVSRDLGLGAGVLAVALAVLLGAAHAFAPGHGKTLMAAYLLGRDGTLRQAAVIGASVTLTHTAGVLVLGVLLTAAALTAPERVYPWLTLASGLLLVGVGLGLLRRARSGGGHSHGPGGHVHGPGGHSHGLDDHSHHHGGHLHGPGSHSRDHGHSHDHDDHGDDGHSHGPGDQDPVSGRGRTAARPGRAGAGTLTRVPVLLHAPDEQRGPRRRAAGSVRQDGGLLAVGFAGGLVPSPSALVVLLGSIALGRAWFGLLLVLAYGVGMALALVGAGLLLVRARGRLQRWSAGRASAGQPAAALRSAVHALPVLTAGTVVLLGVAVAAGAVTRL